MGKPPSIRFVNVGSVDENGVDFNFDIELTNTTRYVPENSALNGFVNGKFAQVNLACAHSVVLRATLLRSCSTLQSCRVCMETAVLPVDRIPCYAAGCSCYGTTVYSEAMCTGVEAENAKNSYNCAGKDTVIVFPDQTICSLTVYDLDTDPNGEYIEQFTVYDYEYFKTPLRAMTDDSLGQTIFPNRDNDGNIPKPTTLTGSAQGPTDDLLDAPSDPKQLTNDQAQKGVQFFFRPEDGSINATFTVSYTGTGTCGGRNLLFAGDSALCAPPPPYPYLPPSPPPPAPPPSPPPPSPPRLRRRPPSPPPSEPPISPAHRRRLRPCLPRRRLAACAPTTANTQRAAAHQCRCTFRTASVTMAAKDPTTRPAPSAPTASTAGMHAACLLRRRCRHHPSRPHRLVRRRHRQTRRHHRRRRLLRRHQSPSRSAHRLAILTS